MKNKNIIFFFIKMLFLAFAVLLVTDVIPTVLTSFLFKNKYGYEVIAEIIMLFIIIIVLIMYKNSYVFTQKKENLFKSIKKGGVLLVIAIIIFIQNISNIVNVEIGTIINLLLYCLAIGMAEEFLCRAWIQNEFIERFGHNRKGIIESIIFSSFIFGVMHFTNILAGQTVLETILQVLQATSSGFLFGAIYYRTGNIWSTIFLHSFYDFAIMLGEAGYARDCTTLANPSFLITLYGYFSSLLIIGLYLLSGIKLLNKEIIEARINDEFPNNKNNNKLINIAIVILFILLMFPVHFENEEEYTICYNYEEYKINEEYELRYSNKKNYQLFNEDIVLNIGINKDNSLIITNPTNGETLELISVINDYIIVDNNEKYTLLVEEFDIINPKVYYLEIDKKTISNDNNYLKKLKDGMTEIMTPTIIEMGYIHLLDNNINYPIIENDLNEIYIIKDKDNINKVK